MMELHEENKVMREALDLIARYQADGPFHARRTLAAIGTAAQQSNAGPSQGDRPIDRKIAAAPLPVYQPAPQAGDALELPPLPAPWGTMYGNSDSGNERDGYTADQMRGYAIDASRREAYDKGLAEGVGQEPAAIGEVVAGGRFVSNVEWFAGYMPPVGTKLYAAPPASAAQQEDELEPFAYAHCMFSEAGEHFRTSYTESAGHDFGRPGIDFSESFTVETIPLWERGSRP